MAERLIDYAIESTQPKKAQLSAPSCSNSGKKSWKPGQRKSGGANKKATVSNSLTNSTGSSNTKGTLSCWLCNGPHRAAQFPHKFKLSSLQALPTQEEQGGEKEEYECRMGALRLLNALKKHGAQVKKALRKGLMFVDATLNGKPAKSVMIDTSTTHNFVSEVEAKFLGLKLEKDVSLMKAINSKALTTTGLAKQVHVKIGTWEGTTDLITMRMDDFDVILGMEFLGKKGAIPIPSTSSLLIMGEKPAIVPSKVKQAIKLKLLSALQFKKGVKRQKPTFVAVPAM